MPVLPVAAYKSQARYDLEQARIFSRTWACAGFVEEITEPGHYLAVQAGLNGISIVMGEDRKLRAFHNICRHRGAQLLRTAGKTRKVIVCPYHDWTYDLEGKPHVIPDRRRAFAGVDLDDLDLKPAAFARWRGMLCVHPSAAAAPVADWFGAIEPHLGPHRVNRLPKDPDARSERLIAANWKIDAAALSRYIHNHSQSHKSLKSQFRQPPQPIPPDDPSALLSD